jgi:hypothetical protein
MLAFVGHLIWLSRGGGWLTAVALGPVAAVVVAVLAGIYWLNRSFVRTNLIPRRDELRMLLASLGEEQEHF